MGSMFATMRRHNGGKLRQNYLVTIVTWERKFIMCNYSVCMCSVFPAELVLKIQCTVFPQCKLIDVTTNCLVFKIVIIDILEFNALLQQC